MFKCHQNEILDNAESSQTFLVKNFSFLHATASNNICKWIADLKQLPGLKKTKMVMYRLTSKFNSIFGTIGKAMADKITAAKVVGKLKFLL